MAALPAAAISFCVSSVPAYAGLKLCNRMSYVVEAAIGIDDKSATATRGWFRIDPAACRVVLQGALKAKRLLLLTDVPGVLDKSKKLIPELSVKDARKLIADGTISGGMIPKVETCIYALEQGVQGVVIIDGKTPHAVLLELFTNQGTGTLIHK